MTTPAADYDTAVRALSAQTLPAFVEYTQEGEAHGLAGWRGAPERVVVDVHAKKIVSITPSNDWNDSDSPVTKHIFDPSCYAPAGERLTNWNGHHAVAISVKNTKSCKEEIAVSTVYADAQTMDLLGADGSETDDDDTDMTIDYSVQYVRYAGYIVPASISAHAHGHGWLFWARERAEIRYSNYTFTDARRQSSH